MHDAKMTGNYSRAASNGENTGSKKPFGLSLLIFQLGVGPLALTPSYDC